MPRSKICSKRPRPTSNPDPRCRRSTDAAVGLIPGIVVRIWNLSASASRLSANRTSWLKFKNMADQILQFEGNPTLFEPFRILPANPASHAHAKAGLATALADWKTLPKAEMLIGGRKTSGETPFAKAAIR